MKKKILVLYLCTKFVSKKKFLKFLKFYNKYNAGISHRLLICLKNFNINDLIFYRRKLKDLKYIEFLDSSKNNDYDFGSYCRVAKIYSDYLILFMNDHSYPIRNNWLKIILGNYKSKSIIATTASYQSISSDSKYRNKHDSILTYFYKFFLYFFKFPIFPNPHLRTTNFLMHSKDFLKYDFPKNYKSKLEAWSVESGRNSLTNFFKRKKYHILVVNSDGEVFKEKDWKKSETYCYQKQSKLILADKHTDKYLSLKKKAQVKKQITVWGR